MIALVFVGLPGSGKTTLARRVATEMGITPIISGDIARDLAKTDSSARADLERGDWAPELAMREEVLARIEAATASSGDFVIEGFPRRLEQLYILESVPNIQPLYFVLGCDPLICIRRLVSRQRSADDHPDAVAARFRAYEEFTAPMIGYLDSQSADLDGSLPTEVLVGLVGDDYARADRER